jgi:hypothetical protein
MAAYTFLIPILPELYNLAQNTTGDPGIILKRLGGYGLITIGGSVVTKLIKAIIDRFRD